MEKMLIYMCALINCTAVLNILESKMKIMKIFQNCIASISQIGDTNLYVVKQYRYYLWMIC